MWRELTDDRTCFSHADPKVLRHEVSVFQGCYQFLVGDEHEAASSSHLVIDRRVCNQVLALLRYVNKDY